MQSQTNTQPMPQSFPGRKATKSLTTSLLMTPFAPQGNNQELPRHPLFHPAPPNNQPAVIKVMSSNSTHAEQLHPLQTQEFNARPTSHIFHPQKARLTELTQPRLDAIDPRQVKSSKFPKAKFTMIRGGEQTSQPFETERPRTNSHYQPHTSSTDRNSQEDYDPKYRLSSNAKPRAQMGFPGAKKSPLNPSSGQAEKASKERSTDLTDQPDRTHQLQVPTQVGKDISRKSLPFMKARSFSESPVQAPKRKNLPKPVDFPPNSIDPVKENINTDNKEDIDTPKPKLSFLLNKANKVNKKKVTFAYKQFTLDDFEIMDKVGKGAFGDVVTAKEKATGFMVVLKKMKKQKIREAKLQEHLIREIKVQSFLKHRHLTSLYGFFSDQAYIYLILELLPDGSLKQNKGKKKLPEEQASNIIRQMCLGLRYMHTENIIHRDIKPQNIFMHEDYIKIGDFGCSVFTQDQRNTVVGTLPYYSPEQLRQGFYDEKVDVWGVGVMAYEMLLGKSPFKDDIMKIASQQMQPELPQLTFPLEATISTQARSFLSQMLTKDPCQRMTIQQTLKHQFITKHITSEEQGCQY